MSSNALDAEECDDGSEQCHTLDKGGSNNHVGEQLVHYLRLASHGIHGLTANLTDTNTCTNGSKTSANCGTQLSNAFYG